MTGPGAQFHPSALYGSVISAPLKEQLDTEPVHRVLIDVELRHPQGREAAVQAVINLVGRVAGDTRRGDDGVVGTLGQYVVAQLSTRSVQEVTRLDRDAEHRAIHRIWPDFAVRPQMNRSAATVKADAARTAFAATGTGVVWAVVDSGIDGTHPHFALHDNLSLPLPLQHRDFTGGTTPLRDDYGHGTHVAGVIAGESTGTVNAVRAELDQNDDVQYVAQPIPVLAGMAPAAKLVSYKVLDATGDGVVSAIIAALQDIQDVNDHGRDLKIHGVNLSVGYPFSPEWFACGQSPLCLEVTRLVRSGVVVVVAAGNTGWGFAQDEKKGAVVAGLDLTINDPGNTEAALTVGSTHREMPHRYGVSYFSSKGPTGDGRAKPDLVAPGERILSCAAGKIRHDIEAKPGVSGPVGYTEDSGTSMAAAHVSGVIAGFLSIRPEFIGCPDEVKRIFTGSATDLGRVPHFQGRGLVDLMRAIGSV